MERKTRALETDQYPEKNGQPGAFEDRAEEKDRVEGSFSFRIKRAPDERGTTSGEHRAKEEKYWRQQVRWLRVTAIATIAAFFAAGWYAYLAHDQNRLTLITLRGTQAAVVDVNFNSAWERGAVELVCTNQGKLAAQRLKGEIEIIRESFPQSRQLGRDAYTFGNEDNIIAQASENRGLTRRFQMTDFTKIEQDTIYAGQENVTARGVVSYDTGLGEVAYRSFCKIFTGVERRFGWGECEETRQWLETVRREKDTVEKDTVNNNN